MDRQSPTGIYDQLIAERGDVPADVRATAERLRRDLARDLEALANAGQDDDPWSQRGLEAFDKVTQDDAWSQHGPETPAKAAQDDPWSR